MSDIRFNRWLHQSGTGGVYQDSSGRVGIGTSVPTTGLDVVGTVRATNVNATNVNVTGISTFSNGIQVGATTSIVVGNTFIQNNSIGLGQTTTTGRNAGVGTAIGTLIVNTTTNQLEVYGPVGWKNVVSLNKTGITATGGTVDTYISGSAVYRYHTFTSSGFFEVTRTGDFGNSVDFLVIGGGGGGSDTGGGGAGGYRTSMPEGPGGPSPVAESGISVSVVSPGYYTITVGGGGAGGADDNIGVSGSPSSVVNVSSSFTPIVSQGGGRGGTGFPVWGPQTGTPGGSAGGGSGNDPANILGPGGDGNRVTGTSTPAPNQGYPGGNSRPDYWTGGGGGGAGGAGTTAPSDPTGGPGGPGKASSITGSPVTRAGGGGGGAPASGGTGGPGGGGNGATGAGGSAATTNTGSGGGGGWGPGGGGAGGSGIVIVRYQIGEV